MLTKIEDKNLSRSSIRVQFMPRYLASRKNSQTKLLRIYFRFQFIVSCGRLERCHHVLQC
jgi:hypothetical protein